MPRWPGPTVVWERIVDVGDVQADPLVAALLLHGPDDIRHVRHESRERRTLLGVMVPTLQHDFVSAVERRRMVRDLLIVVCLLDNAVKCCATRMFRTVCDSRVEEDSLIAREKQRARAVLSRHLS